MSTFSCHTDYEMETSKVHHSELSYSTNVEWSAESNREHFKLLKKDLKYGRFFKDFDTLMLGEKISTGAQADIYEARLQPNAPFDKVVKVMKGEAPLKAFKSQWPVGMLSAHSKFKQVFDLPLITIMGGTLLEDSRFAFLMYRRWGDLRLLIDRRMEHTSSSPFSIEQAIALICNIAKDMKALHEKHDILHRDLKASNVLIWGDFVEDVGSVTTSSGSEKINTVVADFECSVGVLGTGFWRAPEILQQLRDRVRGLNVKFTRASDVYSYGMTCYEIVTGCIPFDGDCNEEMVSKVLLGLRPELPKDLPGFLRNIIVQCWSSDPLERPNFSEICEILDYPVSVIVDNKIHKNATLVQIKYFMNSRPLALLEVIQRLINMELCLWEAASLDQTSNSCDQGFMVTDLQGQKLCDKDFIKHIKEAFNRLVKLRWVTDSPERSTDLPSSSSVPFTALQLTGRSRPGLLIEVSTELDKLNLKVFKAGVWTHQDGEACVIHVHIYGGLYFRGRLELWDRFSLILEGNDSSQVIEGVARQEFPLMERNLLVHSSLPGSPSSMLIMKTAWESCGKTWESTFSRVQTPRLPLVHRIQRIFKSLIPSSLSPSSSSSSVPVLSLPFLRPPSSNLAPLNLLASRSDRVKGLERKELIVEIPMMTYTLDFGED